MMGYADQTARGVFVSAEHGANIEFNLDAAVALELNTIEVRATRPPHDVTGTSTRMAMSSVELKDLPGDDGDEAVSLQRGVIAEGSKLKIRGERESEVKYQVEQVRERDPRAGGQASDALLRPGGPPL